MSWIIARDKIIDIVQGTEVLTKKRGLPPSFKHVNEGSREQVPDSRSFWMMPRTKSMHGALSIGLPRRFRYDVDLVMAYADSIDPTYLAEVMALDHQALSARLPDQTLWGRPSSTIESLFLGDGYTLRTELEQIDGALLDVYRFVLEFTAT